MARPGSPTVLTAVGTVSRANPSEKGNTLSAIMSIVRRGALRLVLSLVAAGVLAGGFLVYRYITNDTSLAKAGDCVTDGGGDANKMKTTKCTDANAKYKVLGRVSGSATSATVETSCTRWPDTEAAMYSEGRSSGYVLCLQEIKR
jgi:hypothetical protein